MVLLNPTDTEIRAALGFREAVALTLWGEARAEPIEGIVGVACVIRNRRLATGHDWARIVHAKLQFSCWWRQGGEANFTRVMTLARSMLTGMPIMADGWRECLWVADGVMANYVRDNTGGARHYLTKTLLETKPPAWAKGRTPSVVLGHHAFIVGVK